MQKTWVVIRGFAIVISFVAMWVALTVPVKQPAHAEGGCPGQILSAPAM